MKNACVTTAVDIIVKVPTIRVGEMISKDYKSKLSIMTIAIQHLNCQGRTLRGDNNEINSNFVQIS